MKKKTETQTPDDDMRPEYDFSGGVRNKYAKEMQEHGYTIRVYDVDGTFTEKRVLGKQTVILAPDVLEYFPDSQAVNHALRTLIALVPEKHKAKTPGRRSERKMPKSRVKT